MLYDILSTQKTIHKDLKTTVIKHINHPWQRPIPEKQHTIFSTINALVQKQTRPVILDSCCGTGVSSAFLAEQHPDCLVIGVDQSLHRLQKNPVFKQGGRDKNLLLVHANVMDFWRLISQASWPIEKHYLLYPNPYPKASDLTKRWQGHPVFPVLMSLSLSLEVRSNWRIYLEEFEMAAGLIKDVEARLSEYRPEKAMTLFERKYIENDVKLYSLVLDL
jgi:tRNA (guanine-N7-)-methyltransferase